jgi:hypothetical protein
MPERAADRDDVARLKASVDGGPAALVEVVVRRRQLADMSSRARAPPRCVDRQLGTEHHGEDDIGTKARAALAVAEHEAAIASRAVDQLETGSPPSMALSRRIRPGQLSGRSIFVIPEGKTSGWLVPRAYRDRFGL